MNLPKINGKDIIPVRLIPAITGFSVRTTLFLCSFKYGYTTVPAIADCSAGLHAFVAYTEEPVIDPETDYFIGMKLYSKKLKYGFKCYKLGFRTYHLHQDGNSYKMLPGEWDNAWYLESTRALSGSTDISYILDKTFVWRDEFEAFAAQAITKLKFTGHMINYTARLSDKDFLLIIDSFKSLLEIHEPSHDTTAPAINTPLFHPYLDPSYKEGEFYSEELAAAVRAWLALYDGGKFKPNRGHKEQIKKELMGKGLSNAAIERIATLVNPNKDGGAPSAKSG
jgi:hypothetical protein